MGEQALRPSTPLEWARARLKVGSATLSSPSASPSKRAQLIFLLLATFGFGGLLFGTVRDPPVPAFLPLSVFGVVILSGSWIFSYRSGRHRLSSVLIETVAMVGPCLAAGVPHRALIAIYAATIYTALFPDLRIARAAGLGYTAAFLTAVGLTKHAASPLFFAVDTLAPAVQLLVVGGLMFSVGRMIERNEQARRRAAALAALGQTLALAPERAAIVESAVRAATDLTEAEGENGVVLLSLNAETWEVLAARGAFAPAAKTIGIRIEVPREFRALSAATLAEFSGAQASAFAEALGVSGEAAGTLQHVVVRLSDIGSVQREKLVLAVSSPFLLAEETRTQLGLVAQQSALALDLERSQVALLRSERLAVIGQLAATVGHELRNPLAAIRSSATFLKKRVGANATDPRVPQFFEVIEREVDASNRIITELLDFARSRPLMRVPTHLHALVEEVRQLVPPKGAHLQNDVPADFPEQFLDRDQIRQVLANLVHNAVDALHDQNGGQVTVRAELKNGSLLLEVEDNGPGMPADVASRAFEPLFTTKTKGTGLGLALVSKVVMSHRGTVSLQRAEPHGVRVLIELPVGDEAMSAPDRPSVP